MPASTTVSTKPGNTAVAAVNRAVSASSTGGSISSGITNRRAARHQRPSAPLLDRIDNGADNIRPPTIGKSHGKKAGLRTYTLPAQTRPSSMSPPCLPSASLMCVSASPRGGDFQCNARPRNAATTKRVWNIIRTGASSIENNISPSMLSTTCNSPPKLRAPRPITSRMPRILGRNSSVAVAENKASACSGCHCGQIGKSWRGCTKYVGSVSDWTASSTVETIRKASQSGAER